MRCWTLQLFLFAFATFSTAFHLTSAAGEHGIVIGVTEHVVFDGLKGWENNGVTYRLACWALLAEAPNGDLLCSWLSGSDNEPATDNCVLLARSTDKGKTWSTPSILIPSGGMAGVVTSIYPTSDGRLILFGAHWPSEEQYTVWHYFRMDSKDSGQTWSEPKPFTLHDNHACMYDPVHLSNGEYLFPVSYFEKRDRPLVGPVKKLAIAKSEEVARSIPPVENGYSGGKFSTHLHGCSVLVAEDENANELKEYGKIGNRPLGLLEPTCVELKDGRIVMLMRAEFGGFLWRAESSDHGRTWTEAWQTDIPNPTSLVYLIRLPDERIALIHNAMGGEVGANSHRDPLSIWISNDELKTWAIKADVIHGGSLAYPNPGILDGRLVFAYDHNRRQVRFVEVTLPE